MTRMWTALERHAVLLAALAITWLVVGWYITANQDPNDGYGWDLVILFFAMCGVAGGVATVIAPAPVKLRAGALGGALTIVAYLVAAIVAQLVHGEFFRRGGIEISTNPAEGGLAEAAVWVVGILLIAGSIGVVGGGIAAALTRTKLAQAEIRGAFLLVVAMVGLLMLLLASPALLGYR